MQEHSYTSKHNTLYLIFKSENSLLIFMSKIDI